MKKLIRSKRFWKNVLLLGASIFILMTTVIIIWFSSIKIPDFNSFHERKIENSIKIYDRTGEVLH
ncbi:MAG: hypothetical protein US12_C0039G0011 [Parcubacteria group bacterium GW2011_GWA2_36_24]|nr:MAG: hypothetical protein US12_C0039G0011 [Parcubacteria group bacterium GW2011_GWA2_36_24]